MSLIKSFNEDDNMKKWGLQLDNLSNNLQA
jgi:hypothetical protein